MSTPRGNKGQATSGGREYLDKTVEVLTLAFVDDPVYNWLLHDHPKSKRQTVLSVLLSGFFLQCVLNDGIVIEVDDFASCGVFMPPNTNVENFWTLPSAGLFSALRTLGLGCFKRALVDYTSGVKPLMKKAFTKAEQKEHWYVFIMGTSVDHRREGHASSLLANLQDRARESNCPIWLEATTLVSKELYLKYGFEIVGEVNLGKGSVGPDGLPKTNGEGITIWSMLWRP